MHQNVHTHLRIQSGRLIFKSHFVACQLGAAITQNVPLLHLPADKHVSFRMFVFPIEQLKKRHVIRVFKSKINIFASVQVQSYYSAALHMHFLLRCRCERLGTLMHLYTVVWAHTHAHTHTYRSTPARAETSGLPNRRIVWGAVMCCFECLCPPVPRNSFKKHNLSATPAWCGALHKCKWRTHK